MKILAAILLTVFVMLFVPRPFEQESKINEDVDYVPVNVEEIEQMYCDLHGTYQYLSQQIHEDSTFHDAGTLEERIENALWEIKSSVAIIDKIWYNMHDTIPD